MQVYESGGMSNGLEKGLREKGLQEKGYAKSGLLQVARDRLISASLLTLGLNHGSDHSSEPFDNENDQCSALGLSLSAMHEIGVDSVYLPLHSTW